MSSFFNVYYLLYFGESVPLKHATLDSVCTVTTEVKAQFPSRFLDTYCISRRTAKGRQTNFLRWLLWST